MTGMNKIVTIIISAYNKSQYLERCVSSLIGKNVCKAEIIIVNDGSTDNTSNIAHKLAETCESIVVVDKENGHQGSCVNVGVQMSTGKYVRMLDADDFFDTDVFDKYIDLLETTDVDMVVTGHIIEYKTKIPVVPLNVPYNTVLNLADIDFNKLGMSGCLGMHGVTYKTDILKRQNIRLTEHCSFTDAEFCYYPLKHCKTVMFMKEILYRYQTDIAEQESSLMSTKIKDDAFLICNKMFGDFENNQIRGGNSDIVLCRCIMAYLSSYLLHFPSNRQDKERTSYLLYKIKTLMPESTYCGIRCATTRKIPFIRIFMLTGMTSNRLFRIMDFIYKYLHR